MHVEFHHRQSWSEWSAKRKLYEKRLEAFTYEGGPNIFSTDIVNYLSHVSDQHPSNKIVGLYGRQFLSLDWSDKAQNFLVFETYKEKVDDRAEAITGNPNNTYFILLSKYHNKLTLITRDKEHTPDQVLEDYFDIKFDSNSNIPSNLPILAIYLKDTSESIGDSALYNKT